MTEFRPTVPPAGRLVRLGIALDTREELARTSEVARMGDGAGIDVLWVRDGLVSPDRGPRLEAWTVIDSIARDVRRASVGAMVDVALRSPATLAALAGPLDTVLGGRLEVALSGGRDPDEEVATRRLDRYASAVRPLLGGLKLSIEASSQPRFDVAALRADDVILPPSAPVATVALIEELRSSCEDRGRDPASIGIAMQLPVSIGRTTAEAEARAEADPLFRAIDDVRTVGVFGTLEQCQGRVIELAHAGVTDLRCIVPNAPDLPDVIAQLTATAIGTTDVLTPGSPRSKAPDPPETWGGRAIRSAPGRP